MNRFFISTGILMIPLIMISCGTQKQRNQVVTAIQDSIAKAPAGPPHLNLPALIGKKREVFLSQLATRVTYIPLETTKEFLIGEKSVRVKPCGEYVFVAEHGKPVGVFDRTGKFIRKIGNIGKGPGEYNFDFNFWPEESSRQVFIGNADKRSIMAFSFEGAYIKDFVPDTKPMSFVPLGKGRIFTWTFMQGEKDGKFYRMVFYDEAGAATSYVFEPKIKYDFSRGIAIMSPLLTPAPEGILYNSWENDTIFRVKADGSFDPALSWLKGNLQMPPDLQKDYQRFFREKDNYLIDFNAFESPSKWFIRYDYKGRNEMACYDKHSSEFFVVANPDTAQRGVYNDIDGGPSFFPSWDNENGHSFVRLINAIDLMDDQQEKTGKNPEPKDAEAAKRFLTMVAGLKENSNPVVMLVEL
jgi:hypothetical protein